MTLSRSFFALALAFVALIVAAAAATVMLGSAGPTPSATPTALVAAVVASVLLWRQGARDLDAVLTLVSAFALLTAVCIAVYLFNAEDASSAPKFALVATTAFGLGAGATTWRRQRSNSADFPNVLASRVPAEQIFETEGVQFTGTMHPGHDQIPHRLAILLQNCFDTSRRVTVRFDAAGYEKYMRFAPEHTLDLGPAEVAQLTCPVIAPTYEGNYPLYISISVPSTSGKRVRLWRAQEATNRIATGTTLALLAVGQVAFGGGVRFTIGPLDSDLWHQELPPPEKRSLWEPKLGTVPRPGIGG